MTQNKMAELENELQELNTTKLNNEKTTLNLHKPPTKHWIYRRVYILSWIKDYDKSFAVSDVIAGLTLGLTIIPQSIAYASLAGLPSQYGLYAAFMGAFVYMIFGTIKEVSIGPTSLMALLTLQYTFNKPPEFAIILAFFAGIVELIMGLLNIGFIVDFISDPVTSAFTSATAIIVIASQIKNFLGIKIAAKGIAETLLQIILKINETSWGDALLGCCCSIFLLLLRQLNLIKLKKSRKTLKRIFWYISIARNAIIVVITSIMAYFLKIQYGNDMPIKLSGNVESGIPVIQLPPFTIVDENETYQFFDIIKELGSGILIIPIVGVLANVAIAKAFTKGKLDASQEMFALGLCNIMGSLFKGIPTCGAFTRSAVSNASGVRTPIAGLYSGIMVIFALSLFTPYFKYIPKATLAAVLICAVVFMVDLKIVLKLYKKNKRDLIGWIGCFVSCIAFGVEIGLLCGIAISIIFLLIKLARPEIDVHMQNIEAIDYIHVQPNSEIIYAAMDFLRTKVNIACTAVNYKLPVVIDCSKISYLDYTSIQNINLLCKEMNEYNLPLVFQNMKKELQIFIEGYNNITYCDGILKPKNLTNV